MSSRVFRRIHGKDELEKLHGKIISKGAEHHSDADDPEDDDDAIVVNHSSTHKKNSNLFALAMVSIRTILAIFCSRNLSALLLIFNNEFHLRGVLAQPNRASRSSWRCFSCRLSSQNSKTS